jgi:hypothetical protein
MIPMLGNLVAKIGLMLLTEKVVKHVLVYTAQHFCKKTEYPLDDQIVKTIAEALGVELPK